MNDSLRATFLYLTKTQNDVAVEVLLGGIDSPDPVIREASVRSLLERREPAGHREIFRRLRTFDARLRASVAQRPDRLLGPVGEAMSDPARCAAACEAIVEYRLYDVLPALITAVETEGPEVERIAKSILGLAEAFYGELSAPADQPRRRDMDNTRQKITTALEESVKRFGRHGRKEIVEAFLLVAKPQNAVFRYQLQQSQDPISAAIVEILSTSARGGVLRLLLGFLEDPMMPQAIKRVIAGRNDARFVESFVQTAGAKPSKGVAETLALFDSFAWAKPSSEVLDQLSETAQACAAGVLTASAIKRPELLGVLERLLKQGKVPARRAAIQAVADIEDPRAAAMVIRALNDEDAGVRAGAIVQLRPRKVPGALSLMIRMADAPQPEIREALHKALPEFNLRQFLVGVDALEPAFRAAAGGLVRKIDPEAVPQLAAEMERLSPVRRRRAIVAADAMDVVRSLETQVIKLLSDEDHMVRIEAARALAECGTKPSWEALRDALLDRSVVVQEAAEQSLERISRMLLEEIRDGQDSANLEEAAT
jgi:HEAT repeat protein